MTDAPDESEAQRGGRLPGDPSLADASVNGNTAKPDDANDLDTSLLPGEKPPEE